MPIRVFQRGQPLPQEMQAAYDYVYAPFINSTVQPPAVADYGQWAANQGVLLNGPPARAARPMAAPTRSAWSGVGYPAAQVQQGGAGARHVPSPGRVMRDAFVQPHSRAPRLYGPSLAQALGDVYRW